MAGIQDMDSLCQGYLTNQYYHKFKSNNIQKFGEMQDDIDHFDQEDQVTYYVSSCEDHFHIVQEHDEEFKELIFPYDDAPNLINGISKVYKEYKR